LRKLHKSHAADEVIGDAQGQLADALQREIALRKNEKPAALIPLYRDLADARLAAGQLDGAENALQKSAELDPKDFVSSRLVGVLREKRGDAAGARQALLASLKVEPKQAMPFIVLGRIDAAAGDLESAKKDFASALANEDGKDARETRQLAALAMKVGEVNKAEALYKTLDTDPDVSAQVGFWLERAAASQALHHSDEVKNACVKARALVESITCPPKSALSPGR
jgi:Flp pilus assembly protein TadD